MVIHAVFFWLREDAPVGQREKLAEDCTAVLAKIPSVRHLWAGRPMMTPRDVVDNSYDVGLLVALDDKAGLDVYQVHPLHMEFLAKHKTYWKRIQIYDFE